MNQPTPNKEQNVQRDTEIKNQPVQTNQPEYKDKPIENTQSDKPSTSCDSGDKSKVCEPTVAK